MIVFIVGLAITAGAYALLPLILANFLTTQITAKRYSVRCYLLNLIIMALFIVISGEPSNSGPYLLWTTVFYHVGKSILKKRNLLVDKTASPEQSDKFVVKPDMYKFICDKCNTPSVSWYKECPRCHAVDKMRNGTDEEIHAWNNLTAENASAEIHAQNVDEESDDSEAGILSSKVEAETVAVQNNVGGKDMYCKYCGTEHTAQQKYCAVCGKLLQEKKNEESTERKKEARQKSTVILIAVAVIVMAIISISWQIFKNTTTAYTGSGIWWARLDDTADYEGSYTDMYLKFEEKDDENVLIVYTVWHIDEDTDIMPYMFVKQTCWYSAAHYKHLIGDMYLSPYESEVEHIEGGGEKVRLTITINEQVGYDWWYNPLEFNDTDTNTATTLLVDNGGKLLFDGIEFKRVGKINTDDELYIYSLDNYYPYPMDGLKEDGLLHVYLIGECEEVLTPESSWIDSIAYYPYCEHLVITTYGREYVSANVSVDTWNDFKAAESKGEFYKKTFFDAPEYWVNDYDGANDDIIVIEKVK